MAGAAGCTAAGGSSGSSCEGKCERSGARLSAGRPGLDGRGGGGRRWKIGDGGVEQRAHVTAWEREDAAAGDILRHHVNGDVEVNNGDPEHEHGKGERGSDACEDGERDGDDEEERYDETIDWVEQRHGYLEIEALDKPKWASSCGGGLERAELL